MTVEMYKRDDEEELWSTREEFNFLRVLNDNHLIITSEVVSFDLEDEFFLQSSLTSRLIFDRFYLSLFNWKSIQDIATQNIFTAYLLYSDIEIVLFSSQSVGAVCRFHYLIHDKSIIEVFV